MSKDGWGGAFYRDDPAGQLLYKKLAAETSGDSRELVTRTTELFDEYAAGPLVAFVKRTTGCSDAAALDTVYSSAGEIYEQRRLAVNAAIRGGPTEQILRHVAKGHDSAERIVKIASAAISKGSAADAAKAILDVTRPPFGHGTW